MSRSGQLSVSVVTVACFIIGRDLASKLAGIYARIGRVTAVVRASVVWIEHFPSAHR
jgi:hypothetical protein